MTKYEDQDGQIFEGATATAVVKAMSRTKLTKSRSTRRYREATARRIEEMMGLTIETGSDNLFLNSLVGHKLLREIE